MKILQLITSLRTGGAENLVTELVPRLQAMGHEVAVMLHDGVDTPFKQKLAARQVKIWSLGENNNVYNPRLISQMKPVFAQFDVVHTHNTACQLLAAIAVKEMRRKHRPLLVTTEHSTDNRRRHLWWAKPLDRWMYRQYQAIISISGIATQLLQDYLGNGQQVITIPNGVDCARFHDAEPASGVCRPGEIVVAMVAAFRVGKQQEVLIRALQHLPAHYRLWLIGDGVRRAECEQIARDSGVTGRVTFWGVRSDVPNMLQAADVLVMSTHYEGMSLSNLEGMATGKPFIASDVNGVREITQGAGILFAEGDDRQLAQEIERVSTDAAYREQVVQRCMARAAQYDINKTASAYNEVYQSL